MFANDTILLAIAPFWSPLIPPMGISCLKSYLAARDVAVVTRDLNTQKQVKDFYDSYYRALRGFVPPEKRGNLHNIGIYVLQDQMMAYLHQTDRAEYARLAKMIIENTFFTKPADSQLQELTVILEGFFDWLADYFIGLVEETAPSVLGLSVYQGTLPASLFLFRLVRKKFPHIKTVMGGGVFAEALAPGSPNYDYFLERTEGVIDHIVIGEGERLFLDLLQGRLPQEQRVFTLDDIDWQLLDLSAIDVPDFSDLDIEGYPHLSAFTGRSCPYQCGFCSETMQWGKYRRKKADQVAEELKTLSERHRFQLFLMGDSLLNPVISDLADECVRRELPVYWDGYLRAEKPVCKPENAQLWRRGGYYRARIGAESGSPRILQSMNKQITVEQIKGAVSSLASAGIKTTTYWVIGYPGETEEDFLQTLALIEEMKDDLYEADCNPFAYFFKGQVNSQDWGQAHNRRLLYPEWARESLITQTWILDSPPLRDEIFRRLNRFIAHCRKLNIPNPYSLREIYAADERWKKLHPNAVPSVLEFEKNKDSGEAVKDDYRRNATMASARAAMQDDGDWGF